MKYYVYSQFFNNGKVKIKILLESEMDFDKYKNESTERSDNYVDEFESMKEAEEFIGDYNKKY